MKIKKHIIESIIEEELHSVLMENKDALSEDWKSAFVRGITAGGKRKNIFTDTIASMMVPGVTKEAHTALTQALKAIEGMKKNAQWDRVTTGADNEVEGSTSAAYRAMSKKTISLVGMEKIIRGLLKDLGVLAAQLGADKPEMKDPEETETEGAPEAEGEAETETEGGEGSGAVEFPDDHLAESLRRSIRAKMRRLKSTS